MEYAFDRVNLTLSASRDIRTETVRVHVEAVVAATPEQAGGVPELIRSTLGQVLSAEWTTSFGARREDNSGMEQIVVQASTRVADAQTAGLGDRLRKASRSGLALKLRGIEFRPPRKQIDAVKKELREEIYRLARAEAEALNEVLPSDTQPWRVGSVTVSQVQEAERRAARRSAYMSGTASEEYAGIGSREGEPEGGNLVVGVRVELQGEILLHRLSVLPPRRRRKDDARGE